jgi:hypothetical protein
MDMTVFHFTQAAIFSKGLIPSSPSVIHTTSVQQLNNQVFTLPADFFSQFLSIVLFCSIGTSLDLRSISQLVSRVDIILAQEKRFESEHIREGNGPDDDFTLSLSVDNPKWLYRRHSSHQTADRSLKHSPNAIFHNARHNSSSYTTHAPHIPSR